MDWRSACTQRSISYLTCTKSLGSKKLRAVNRWSVTLSGRGLRVPCCRKASSLASFFGMRAGRSRVGVRKHNYDTKTKYCQVVVWPKRPFYKVYGPNKISHEQCKVGTFQVLLAYFSFTMNTQLSLRNPDQALIASAPQDPTA